MSLVIYHNQTCTKSNSVYTLLVESGKKFSVINYLQTPLHAEELKALLKKLRLSAIQIIRQNEAEFLPYINQTLSDDDCIKLLEKYPNLLQRPIVVNGAKAIIARPPENVLTIL